MALNYSAVIREFTLIGRDPVLTVSLLLSGFFLLVFIVVPLLTHHRHRIF
jgi:hypothetical protein